MKPEEINERFAKAAGIKLHSWITKGTDGKLYTHSSPDFCADPRLVLEVMDKNLGGRLFYAKLMYHGDNVEARDDDGYISRYYMTDKSGLLALKAAEYLETEGGKK